MRRLLLLALFLIGCGEDTTSVVLDVTYDDTWMLDGLAVTMGGEVNATDVRHEIRVLVPDEWAGQEMNISLDGTRTGVRFAHGETAVMLKAGQEVHAAITLVALPGAVCDPLDENACTDVPGPTCVSATTLRTSTGPGMCVDQVCKYEYTDFVCPNGCADNACICDSVTETQNASIALTTVLVDRTFKVNGVLVPDSTLNGYGALFLRNTTTGDEISWGQTYQAAAPVSVIAGTYDVFYELTTVGSGSGGAVTVPRNKRTKVASAVDLTTPRTVALEVTAVKADRAFKLNGTAVPDSTANGYGALYLRTAAGDEISWGQTYTASAPVQVVAGTYDVYYEMTTAGTGAGGAITVPRNKRARIAAAASITTTTPLTLDITVNKVDRTFTLNGGAVPDSSANGYGSLFIRTAAGDEATWGLTYQPSVPVQLIAGTYDVFYEFTTAGTGTGGATVVPRNKRAKIASGMQLNSTTPVALALTVVKVDRTFKVNSTNVPDTTLNGYGALFIRKDGDEIAWGQTYQTTSVVQIIAGTYDIYYDFTTAGSGTGGAVVVPRNKRARIMSAVSLTTTTPLALDVTAVKLDRTFKVNGQVLTDTTINGYGALFLRNTTGDEIAWGQTYQPSVPIQTIAGPYDVYFESTAAGTGAGSAPVMPRNKRARVITAMNMTSPAPLEISTTVVKVDRTFKVNGVLVPDSTVNGYGALFMRNGATTDEIAWGQTYQPSVRVPVLAGRYDPNYELTTAGSGAGAAVVVPRNKHAGLTCVDVKP